MALNDFSCLNSQQYLNQIITKVEEPKPIKNDDFELKNIYFKVKDEFKEYVSKKFSHTYSVSVVNHLIKIFETYQVNSISELKTLINSGKIHNKGASLGIRVLLNYSESNDLMDMDTIDTYRRRVKIHSGTHIDRFIPKYEQILSSIKYLKENLEKKYVLIYRFMIETSCRHTEAIDFFKNFDEKHLEIKNDICAYANFYLRGKKTSFYLLFTKSLYDELKPFLKKITDEDMTYLKRKSHREDELVCLKYLRKYSFTLMIMNEIPIEIANMISGRSQKSNVGITHYLNQKEIMLKEYQKVVKKMTEFV